MSVTMHLASRCSWASTQAARLAADAMDAYRAGTLLLRGSPFALGCLAGWLSTEFPPHVLTGHALSRVSHPSIGRVGTTWAAQRADQALTTALEESLGSDFREQVCHPAGIKPVCAARGGLLGRPGPHRRYAAQTSDIPYGPGGRDNLLDVWRRHDLAPGRRAPVLIQVPGGAWTVGDKRVQAYTLMSRMAELGWICVSINYCKSPRSTFPAHLIGVKRAIAWVRQNIADYGGDPDFVAVTGGSAGGHLCALAALTPNDPQFQPGFEDADTSVAAAVPIYGRYDWFSTEGEGRPEFVSLLEKFVVKRDYDAHRDVYVDASPIRRLRADAPPFFVLHGCDDSLIPVGEAQEFIEELRAVSKSPVAYAELPSAQHAFDIFSSPRAHRSAEAVARFLSWVYATNPPDRG
jgi:acetyl esterase/lipase